MFKRILVAVDASDTGEQALQMAIGLAAESQSELRVVHAVDVSNINLESEPIDHSAMTEKIKKNGQETLSKAEAAAAAAGIKAETNLIVMESLKPRIAEAVIEDADAWPADLIVIGTHGRRGISRLVAGSVAEEIVRGASQPVLLTRGT